MLVFKVVYDLLGLKLLVAVLGLFATEIELDLGL